MTESLPLTRFILFQLKKAVSQRLVTRNGRQLKKAGIGRRPLSKSYFQSKLQGLETLGEVVAYIARNNPSAARKTGESILKKVLVLGRFPRIGKVFPELAREDVKERFPFVPIAL